MGIDISHRSVHVLVDHVTGVSFYLLGVFVLDISASIPHEVVES